MIQNPVFEFRRYDPINIFSYEKMRERQKMIRVTFIKLKIYILIKCIILKAERSDYNMVKYNMRKTLKGRLQIDQTKKILKRNMSPRLEPERSKPPQKDSGSPMNPNHDGKRKRRDQEKPTNSRKHPTCRAENSRLIRRKLPCRLTSSERRRQHKTTTQNEGFRIDRRDPNRQQPPKGTFKHLMKR